MKKWLILLVLGINIIGLFLFLPISPFNVKKQTIYIAVAGPMMGVNQENGQAMLRGVNMCLEQFNAKGGFKDKAVTLLVYNDKNRRTAINIASRIADEASALLVIGHFDSAESIAAGTIYRKNGIPAITASATSESVTYDNDWYFRVAPNTRFIRNFTAHGIKNLLGETSASIIYDKTDYGVSLARGFEAEAKKLDITIKNRWAFDSDSDSMKHDLSNIIGDLRAARETGTIFCATQNEEGVKFFASCRYPGTDYSVIGPCSFSTPAFISHFNVYPRERQTPGYYTDGILATSPFIAYLADQKEAVAFREEYLNAFGEEPSWVAACYYEAMNVAINAIIKAEIQGRNIREDRRRVKNALASLNEYDVAVRGITGDIYFDKNGDVSRPLALGAWHANQFLPTYWQYRLGKPQSQPIAASNEENQEKALATTNQDTKKTIHIEGLELTPLRVVYTGVDINKISRIDVEKGIFSVDFYLWFRFIGPFDDKNIRFKNVVSPITLGNPLLEDTFENTTIRAYRVIADFQTHYDTQNYPLDRHDLRILFQHNDQSRDQLIYVPDTAGLPDLTINKMGKKKMNVKTTSGWEAANVSFLQGISKSSNPQEKKSVSFSEFGAKVRVQREGHRFIMLKTIVPLIAAAAILYLSLWVSPTMPAIRIILLLITVFVMAGVRLFYNYTLPGIESLTILFLTGYVLIGLVLFISIFIRVSDKRQYTGKRKFLPKLAQIIYPACALSGFAFWLYTHWPWLYFD